MVPSLSAALALIVIAAGAVNDEPLVGDEMLTVGATFADDTVTVTADDVVVTLALSVAFAMIE